MVGRPPLAVPGRVGPSPLGVFLDRSSMSSRISLWVKVGVIATSTAPRCRRLVHVSFSSRAGWTDATSSRGGREPRCVLRDAPLGWRSGTVGRPCSISRRASPRCDANWGSCTKSASTCRPAPCCCWAAVAAALRVDAGGCSAAVPREANRDSRPPAPLAEGCGCGC